jgi:rod shape-determining protein MreC
MNKELFVYFSVLIALLMGAFFYSTPIQSPVISSLNYIKTSYHNVTQSIDDTIDKHFFQADEIEDLKKKLQKYENNHLVMQELATEIQDLYQIEKSPLHSHPEIQLIRAISYEKFGNFNRLWMDIPDYNSSKIYGLTYNEYVAGIVINKDEKPLALLNKDIKSAYSVYVGDNNAPGIANGNNKETLMVNFIPAWYKIKEGDEVTSSGLDNIFIKGLKVGKVISITSSQGYQHAIIEPYYKANNVNYFHMIKEVR